MAVYLVERVGAPADERPRIVEAGQRKRAINHVAADTLVATVISTKEAMALAKGGVELETAGD